MPERRGLEHLFNPASVAVIGATENVMKWGFSTFLSIMETFPGPAYPVNIRDKEVLGHQAYPSVTDIPGEVDLAVFVIPADGVRSVMESCVEKGVKAAVIITAGFAETGPEGKALQDSVMEVARRGDIRVVGPNCMGFWTAAVSLRAFMFPLPVMDGPIGFVSQGGNVGGSAISAGFIRGLGFRAYVSCGCAADIQIEDYIEHYASDPEIKVILAYIEGLQNGRRFVEKAGLAARTKPVIVMKPGRGPAAAHAIVSHSGALAGSDKVFEAACHEAGLLRVDSTEEMLDLAAAFLTQPLPRNRNVCIVTPGGSYGVVCADACEAAGLNVPDLSQEALAELDTLFPPRWSHGNPVDPAGDRNFISYLKAPTYLLELEDIGSLIYMGFGSFSAMSTNLSQIELDAARRAVSQLLNGIEGLQRLLHAAMDLMEARDIAALKELLTPLLTMIALVIGSGKREEMDDFIDLVTELLASGWIRFSEEDFEQVIGAVRENDIGMIRWLMSAQVEKILTAMVMHWIDRYGKPVITTNFAEVLPRVIEGLHHPYPSGERAAKVLGHMASYADLLRR